jgi:putative ABC transport system permease protein
MTTTAAPPAPPDVPVTEVVSEPSRPGGLRGRVVGALLIVLALAMVATGVISPPAIVLSLPFVYLLIRKPVLRRLALRNAARRPRETMLILLGALLGTAIITSSYVVGDTMRSSIRGTVYSHLGPIDELVLTNGTASGAAVRNAVAAARLTGTDGEISLLTLPVSASSEGPDPKAEPTAQMIETDFAAARTFGGDTSATGISGPTPTGDEAAISADLADITGVRPGSRVTVYAYGTSISRRVVRILPRVGVAGLRRINTFGNLSPNVFVGPGTIEALQRAGGASGSKAAPPIALVAVSNTGGVLDGAKGSAAVTAQLRQAVRGLPAQVSPAKQDELDFADRFGKQFTRFFQYFGSFSVLAGILLLINIFVMLAQERKQSLGMLRAVGLRRSGLVGSFSLEGWLYALGSSALGAVLGIGIGRLVVVAASNIFNGGTRRRGNGLNLRFSGSLHSVQQGFGVGFIIALVTVVLASLYVARLNVIRAIRDLPEPPAEGRRLGRLIAGSLVGLLGVGLTVGGAVGSQGMLLLIGPALLGLGLIAALRMVPIRTRVTIVAVLVITWAIVAFGIAHKAFQNTGIPVFVVQGIILVTFAVGLVTENQESIGAAIRAVGGGTRNMSLRLGLAYPLAKRFRTGLILAMYSIVVFFLVFLSVFSYLFSRQVTDQTRKISGGAAIQVISNPANPVPAEAVSGLPGVTLVAATSESSADLRAADKGTDKDFQSVDSVVGFDASFIGHGAPAVKKATSEAVFRTTLDDPTKVIIPAGLLSRGFGGGSETKVGQRLLIRDSISGQVRTLEVAGILNFEGFGSEHVYVSHTFAESFFGPRATPSLLSVSTKPGTDNDSLAASINGRFVANGADASSFHQIVNRNLSAQLQFFTLIKGYVGLGLLVGIAGLGVVMVRAVRERRRDIGVLRSLGFSRIAVRRAFVAESSFVALEGIGVGTILALITAWRTASSGAFGNGLSFAIPWAELIILVVATAAASLLATAAPAIQASRIRPAVALRIAD